MFLTDSSAATTPGLELEVIETGGQLLVQIVAAEPLTAEAVLFELNYSPARYSPQVVQATDVFAAPADSLCIEVMDIPGVVSFGQVSLGVAGQEIQAGGVLADVLFSTEPLDAVRVAADVPVHSGALCPLTCDAKAGDLTLHYVNPGDYDQNGLVSVSDLVPLGRHFRESGPFEFGSALSVADGNRNGQIEVADLSVIGRNWGHNVAAFNFYGSNSVENVPAGYSQPSMIEPLESIGFTDAEGDPTRKRLHFKFRPEVLGEYRMYWARPEAEGSEGIASNLAGPAIVAQPGSQSNALPDAQISVSYEDLAAPVPAILDASGSSDLDGVIVFYEWDFEGDGLYDGFSSDPAVEHIYAGAGTYAPLVRVTDNLGAWAVAQAEAFTVTEVLQPNLPPAADIVATVASGTAPLSVGFIASGSSDSDGYIVKYEWDFDGDGVPDLDSGADPTVIHTYEEAGKFYVTVTVTDDRGDSDTDSVEISVSAGPLPNEPPVAHFAVDVTYGDAPLTVHFNAGESYDPDGSIVRYEWDFDGDGNFEAYGSKTTITQTYVDAGYLYPALRVIEDDGAWAGSRQYVCVNPAAEGLDAWPMFGHDRYHTRRAGVTGPRTEDMDWSYAFGLAARNLSLDDSGILYCGSGDYHMYAINPDRSFKWAFATGGIVYSNPVFDDDGTAYFGSTDDNVYAVNPDGSLKWSFTTGADVTQTPAIAADGTIYAASHDSKLYALNPDGSLKWSYLTGAQVFSPTVGADGTVYFSSLDHFLYALNHDGTLKWSYDNGDYIVGKPAIGPDGTVYCIEGYNEDRLFSFAPDGSLRWTYELVTQCSTNATVGSDGTVYFGNNDSLLYAINPDGTLKWTYEMNAAVTCKPVITVAGKVMSGDSHGHFHVLNADGTLDWEYAGYSSGDHNVVSAVSTADGAVCVLWEGRLVSFNSDGSIRWSFRNENNISSPAIDVDGAVYIGGSDNSLYAFNPDGSVRWSEELGGEIYSSPAVTAEGAVYVGCADGNLYAYSTAGNLEWTFPTDGIVWSSPCVAEDGTLYFGSYDHNVYALNPDGSLQWQFETGGIVWSSPAVDDDGTVYVGSSDCLLYALHSDGTVAWTYEAGFGFNSSPAIGVDGTVYAGSGDGNLYAFNPDGSLQWSFASIGDNGGGFLSSPAVSIDGTIVIGCSDNSIYALRPDGSIRWRVVCESLGGGSFIPSPAIDADGVVYLYCMDGIFRALNPDGTLLWSHNPIYANGVGGAASSAAIGPDGTVYTLFGYRLCAFGSAE